MPFSLDRFQQASVLAESAPQIDADDRREVHLAQLQLEELIVIVQAQGDPHRYAVGIGKHGRGNVASENLGRAGQEHHAPESDDFHVLHLDAGGVARCVMAAYLAIHRSQAMAGWGKGVAGGACRSGQRGAITGGVTILKPPPRREGREGALLL